MATKQRHQKPIPEPDVKTPSYNTIKALMEAVNILRGTHRNELGIDRAVTFRDIADGALKSEESSTFSGATAVLGDNIISPNFSHASKIGWSINSLPPGTPSYLYMNLNVSALSVFGAVTSKNFVPFSIGYSINNNTPADFSNGAFIGRRLQNPVTINTLNFATVGDVTAAYTAWGMGTPQENDTVTIDTELYRYTSGVWVTAADRKLSSVTVGLAPTVQGWRNLAGEIIVRGTGAGNPPLVPIPGSVIELYSFTNAVGTRECFTQHIVQHDLASGTAVVPTISFIPSTNVAGNLKINFQYSVAASGNQAGSQSVFDPATLITTTLAIPAGSQGKHLTLTLPSISSVKLEPGSAIIGRMSRDNTVAGNFVGDMLLIDMYMRYQFMRYGTTNPAFPFG